MASDPPTRVSEVMILSDAISDPQSWEFGNEEDTQKTAENHELDFENELKVYRRTILNSATQKPFVVKIRGIEIKRTSTDSFELQGSLIMWYGFYKPYFEALCSQQIADGNWDTPNASNHIRNVDEVMMLNLFSDSNIFGDVHITKDTIIVDVELELSHVLYTDSVAAITMEGPAFVACFKLADACLHAP